MKMYENAMKCDEIVSCGIFIESCSGAAGSLSFFSRGAQTGNPEASDLLLPRWLDESNCRYSSTLVVSLVHKAFNYGFISFGLLACG